MLNEIKLNANFYDDEAEKLKSCFSPGVIELVEDPNKDGRKKAVVKNARLDMCSRQVFMHDEFKNLVELFKIRDHFICILNDLNRHIFQLIPNFRIMKSSFNWVHGSNASRRPNETVDRDSHEKVAISFERNQF